MFLALKSTFITKNRSLRWKLGKNAHLYCMAPSSNVHYLAATIAAAIACDHTSITIVNQDYEPDDTSIQIQQTCAVLEYMPSIRLYLNWELLRYQEQKKYWNHLVMEPLNPKKIRTLRTIKQPVHSRKHHKPMWKR